MADLREISGRVGILDELLRKDIESKCATIRLGLENYRRHKTSEYYDQARELAEKLAKTCREIRVQNPSYEINLILSLLRQETSDLCRLIQEKSSLVEIAAPHFKKILELMGSVSNLREGYAHLLQAYSIK